MLPVTMPSRQQAILEGLMFYRPERPCKRGHFAMRYTSNSVCSACADERYRSFDEEAKELHRQRARKYQRSHREARARYSKEYRRRKAKQWDCILAVAAMVQNGVCGIDHEAKP